MEVLLATFVQPSLELLRTHPRVVVIIERVKAFLYKLFLCLTCRNSMNIERNADLHRVVLVKCDESKNQLVAILHIVLLVSCFGGVVPLLLIMAPMFIWSQTCMLRWRDGHAVKLSHSKASVEGTNNQFPRILASNLLVRQPIKLLSVFITSGGLTTGVLLM